MKQKICEEKIILNNRSLKKVIEDIISKKSDLMLDVLKKTLSGYASENLYKYTLMDVRLDNIMYIVGMAVVKEGAIAYWSALYYHNLCDRISRIIYVQTTKKRGYRHYVKIGGETVVKVYGFYVKPVVIKREKYFGVVRYTDEATGIEYAITDREKTVVDCVDKPRYCGGFAELIPGIMYSNLDYRKIVEYVKRMQNYTVIKRMGYIVEKLNWGIENELWELLPNHALRTYSLLDPTAEGVGAKNKKWRLIINVPDNIWESELL